MRHTLEDGTDVVLIGDPHLGKAFDVGVPLDRRGERERQQLQKFKQLLEQKAAYIVIVGDLFDHPYVGYSVVLDAYRALANAAAAHRDTKYIVMAGNHDMPRNLSAIGAFDLLAALCHMRADNLFVTEKPMQVGPIALYPWQWGTPARLQQIIAPVTTEPVQLVVGHWDLHQFGDHADHMAPVKLMRAIYGRVPLYSGHYHTPGEYVVDGEIVHCTGSMEPYSHGEDPKGEIYITLTPAEIEAIDPCELRDKCVRVLLRDGEEMPTGIDCLALTPKRVTADVQGSENVVKGEFSWSDILHQKLSDLPPVVRLFIEERLKA